MTLPIVKRVLGIFVIIFLMGFNINLYSQEEVKQPKDSKTHSGDTQFKKTATDLTSSLSKKVNLTLDQSKEITTTLIDYQKNLSSIDPMIKANEKEGKISEIDKDAQAKISKILNDNQMTAFNSTKDEWWKEVRSKVYPETVREQPKNKEKEKPY